MAQRLFLVCIWLLLLACGGSIDNQHDEILTYLRNNNFTSVDTNGIYLVLKKEGSLERPKEDSSISLSYTAKYLNDVVFDQSPEGKKSNIKLSTAIGGLKNSLKLLGKNSEALIIIPPSLGFGNNPPFGVEKNAVLIYDVIICDF